MVYACWIFPVAAICVGLVAGFLPLLRREDKPAEQDRLVYDFTVCYGVTELIHSLAEVNRCGYLLLCVTESDEGYYTLFFRRPEEVV
ncbi:MAG: hypothetical protein ACI3W5_07485 [Faecousia sp.]